jgi:glutamine cyclotransferase
MTPPGGTTGGRQDQEADVIRVFLIRHGESESNAGLASSDPGSIPLMPDGHRQAGQIARVFSDIPALIVTSPYLRARQTAQPTISGLPAAASQAHRRLARPDYAEVIGDPVDCLNAGRLAERPGALAGRRVVRFHRVQTLRRLPHPGRGFTQGLVLDGDLMWESTGQYGQSSLRRYRLGAEQFDWSAPLPDELFGEGICLAGDRLWQLTWQERVALNWPAKLGPASTVPAAAVPAAAVPAAAVPAAAGPYTVVRYNREGWGICNAGRWAVTSDGSSELVLRDLLTLEPLWTVLVRCEGRRVGWLNDLEWQAGRVWANVGSTACLVSVDLPSGEVVDVVDARAVAAGEHATRDPQSVMNGIAAVPGSGDFLLTGKNWKSIHQVRLVPDRKARRAERLLGL